MNCIGAAGLDDFSEGVSSLLEVLGVFFMTFYKFGLNQSTVVPQEMFATVAVIGLA